MRTCIECGDDTTMSEHAWNNLATEERRELRARGVHCYAYKGMCKTCAHRDWRRRNPRPERTTMPIEVVAEEWTLLVDAKRSQAANVRLLAPRLGMSSAALERAVLRAKRLGLLERAA